MTFDKGNGESSRNILTVPPDIEPIRLDKFLASSSELSLTRSKIQKLITSGEIVVDNRAATSRMLVKGNEQILINIPGETTTRAEPEDIAIEIIYQDKYLAVVNKPAGMVTHPAAGNHTGTLVNALLFHLDKLSSSSHAGDELRPGIVHRLDKNTSGLLVVAKNDSVHLQLQEAIQEKKIARKYLGLICGHMKEQSGMIDLPIGRSLKDRKKMAVTHLNSRAAITEYEVIDSFRIYDLLELSLQTGRTHQIRVHLAHLRHPVFGDPDYGGREKWHKGIFAPERPLGKELLSLLGRQALHSFKLEFQHPATGEALTFECQPPDDMQKLLDILSEKGR